MRDLNTLSSQWQRRLRCIHHVTSVATAIQILETKSLWSKDPGFPANFTINPDCVDLLSEPREVSLIFRYEGVAKLVPFDFDVGMYQRDVLYIHVTNGLYDPNLEKLRVWAARWPMNSSSGMSCVGFDLFRDFHVELKRNSLKQLMVLRLLKALGTGIPVSVPKLQEIEALLSAKAELNFGTLERLKQLIVGKNPMPISSLSPSLGQKDYEDMLQMHICVDNHSPYRG